MHDKLIELKIAAKWHGYTAINGDLKRTKGSLPRVVVVGAQRSGSTSLYEWFAQNPGLRPSTRKEVHYFDLNAGRPIEWYRAHFPVDPQKPDRIPFEITPYYLFHGGAVQSLIELVPEVRIIVLLRDPASRMVSHIQHSTAKGYESRDPTTALHESATRYDGCHRPRRFPDGRKFFVDLDHYSRRYVARSDYGVQLESMYAYAAKDQVHVADSDALFRGDSTEVDLMASFLNVDLLGTSLPHSNTSVRPPAAGSLHREARAISRDLNRDLSNICDRDFTWQE